MAALEEVIEEIDEAAVKAAKAFYARNLALRTDPKYQALQLQSLAITLAMLAREYGIGEEQLQRVVGAAQARVIDARGCSTTEVAEA
jgi:hypothetical protein